MSKTIYILGTASCAACKTVKSVAETGIHEVKYLDIQQDEQARLTYDATLATSPELTRELPLTIVLAHEVDEQTSDILGDVFVGHATGLKDSLALIRNHKE